MEALTQISELDDLVMTLKSYHKTFCYNSSLKLEYDKYAEKAGSSLYGTVEFVRRLREMVILEEIYCVRLEQPSLD